MQVTLYRYRIGFGKRGALRWTGHLDLQRCWERTFRRARLPLRYSGGFHPHPRIVFGAALPLGFTSEGELLDVHLSEPRTEPEMLASLRAVAQPGLSVDWITVVACPAPAVPTIVQASMYEVRHPAGPSLETAVERLLAAQTLLRTRRGKDYDLRPLVEDLRLREGDQVLQMQLACREGATGRPEEVLDQLGLDHRECDIHRTRLLLRE